MCSAHLWEMIPKIETGAAEAMGAYELGSDAPEKNRLIKQIIE